MSSLAYKLATPLASAIWARDNGAELAKAFDDFEFWRPAVQTFPTSTTEVALAGFVGTVLAAWGFQEQSGTTFADFSGNGLTLTKNGAATKALLGQRFVGPFDGAAFNSHRCYEGVAGGIATDRFELASNASLNDWTGQRQIVVVWRAPVVPGGTLSFFGKTGGSGYISFNTNVAGSAIITVFDGTTAVTSFVGANHCDGALHFALITIDPTGADTIRCETDLGSGTAMSTAAINWNNVPGTATQPWTVGGQTGGHSPAPGQVRFLMVLDGIGTSLAAVNGWWKHGKAPSWLTYSRASSMHSTVQDDPTTGDVLASWATGSVAYLRNSLVTTNPLKLELAVSKAATNLIPNTDVNDATNWPATGTKTAYSENSPRGFREAAKHTGLSTERVLAAAANGASVTAATVYTAHARVRWNGSGTAPKVKVYRADGTTQVGTADATIGTSKDHLVWFTFTAPATEAVRFAFEGRDGNAWFSCPMINAGSYPMSFIQTKGGTASTVAVLPDALVPGLTSDYGAMKVWATLDGQDSNANRAFASAMETAVTSGTARLLYCSSGETIGMYDGAASQAITGIASDLAAVENVVVGQWDDDSRYGWTKRVHRQTGTTGASNPAENNTALPSRTSNPVIAIGCRNGEQIDGGVSKVRVWRYPETQVA